LRLALAEGSPAEVRRLALDRLAVDLDGAPAACWGFFDTLFSASGTVTTVQALAARLRLSPTQLASRLYRLSLPTAVRSVDGARLVRAARLLENPGLSIANVSNRLEYSSPQAFGRHLGVMMRITASTFRREYTGERMLEMFRAELVVPFVDALRQFD